MTPSGCSNLFLCWKCYHRIRCYTRVYLSLFCMINILENKMSSAQYVSVFWVFAVEDEECLSFLSPFLLPEDVQGRRTYCTCNTSTPQHLNTCPLSTDLHSPYSHLKEHSYQVRLLVFVLFLFFSLPYSLFILHFGAFNSYICFQRLMFTASF